MERPRRGLQNEKVTKQYFTFCHRMIQRQNLPSPSFAPQGCHRVSNLVVISSHVQKELGSSKDGGKKKEERKNETCSKKTRDLKKKNNQAMKIQWREKSFELRLLRVSKDSLDEFLNTHKKSMYWILNIKIGPKFIFKLNGLCSSFMS